MFRAIGAFAGRLLGSDKAVESVINNVSKGLDKLVYTGEEQAEAQARDVSEARLMIIEWMKGTQGQNLARRILALSITYTWLFYHLLAQLIQIGGIWAEQGTALKLQASALSLTSSADQMSGAMMLILGFYFAAPHMDKLVGPAMAMFSKKANK